MQVRHGTVKGLPALTVDKDAGADVCIIRSACAHMTQVPGRSMRRPMSAQDPARELHGVAEGRLRRVDQRYTAGRRAIIERARRRWPSRQYRRHRRPPSRPAAEFRLPASDRPGVRRAGPPGQRQRRVHPVRARRRSHRPPPPPGLRQLRESHRHHPAPRRSRTASPRPQASSPTLRASSPTATASTFLAFHRMPLASARPSLARGSLRRHACMFTG